MSSMMPQGPKDVIVPSRGKFVLRYQPSESVMSSNAPLSTPVENWVYATKRG